jgi:MFS family permease
VRDIAPDATNGSRPHDPLLVVVVAIAVALAVADSSVVVLALPDLYGTFDVSIVGVSWTITAYNLAIVVGALAVVPLAARVPGHVIAAAGLATFSAASLVCGIAASFDVLVAARCVQGAGAALALAGAVPVLAGIRGSDAHAIAVWGVAATVGAALGPALGGLLTDLFSWRAIFVLQAPLGALALVAVADRRVRAVEIAPQREPRPRTLAANLGFLLLYGALVGALFLAVLLLVVVWGWSPLTGAAVVSALPVGAVGVRRLGHSLPNRAAAATGGAALGGGLATLALLPAASAWWAMPALAACGVGLGLLGGVLAPAAVPVSAPGAATISIAARHAGFVIALAVLAPLLAADLDAAALDATRATTAEILDSPVAVRTKVDVALDLRDLVADAPRGEVPDPATVFDAAGADGDDRLRATRDGVTGAIRDTITRAFRPSFLLTAAFGVAAALVALTLPPLRGRPPGADAGVIALLIVTGVIALLAGTQAAGARDYGTREYVDPCTAPADPFPQVRGIDGTLQRIALSAINGAACELGTGREELVLSLEPRSGFGPEVTWTRDALEGALRAGLVRAIDDADARDTLPGLAARGLRFVAERAPLDWILGRVDIPFLEE